MRFETPAPGDVPGLRRLWREAFGDPEEFLDAFYAAGFAPARCRMAVEDGALLGAAYWFDSACRGLKLAYLYGVATAKAFRGRGVCHRLMADIHGLLRGRGYAGAVLVPAGGDLAELYRGMGYGFFGGVDTLSCAPGKAVDIHPVDGACYERLREAFLPDGGVEQPGASVAFLQTQASLYAGEGFLLAARKEGDALTGLELLGDASAAPGITAALGARKGSFRVPGEDRFAMFLPLQPGVRPPSYFGLAFD